MLIQAEALGKIVRMVFEAAGSSADEARSIANKLVDANLTGHDSHGVVRIPQYVEAVLAGKQVPNQTLEVVSETGSVLVVDGRRGFGQVLAEEAIRRGIEKATSEGIALVALRNTGHVGRLADYAVLATEAGQAAIIFCNACGLRPIVAPHGGRDGRGSTNPIAIAVPVAGDEPIVLDFATASIAEGKVRVARNKGVPVPETCLLDGDGQATTDPQDFYADPPGVLLPLGGGLTGHKGSGLMVLADLLSGAFTGGQSNWPAESADPRRGGAVNNLFAILVAPGAFLPIDTLEAEVRRYAEFVKSSRPRDEGGEVLLPGEPERRVKAERSVNGIPLDLATWTQIKEAAGKVGVAPTALKAVAAAGVEPMSRSSLP